MIKKIKKIKTVILGCGEIAGLKNRNTGSFLNHASEVQKNKYFDLFCNIEKNKYKREKFKSTYKVSQSFKSLNEFLDSKIKSDLIVICTNTKSHYLNLIQLIKNNFKNILCEKPVCENKYQLKKLSRLIKKKKVNVFVNFNRKEDLQVKKLKNVIKSGALGKIKFVNCIYSKGILNNGIHLLDLLLFLFNKISILNVFNNNQKKNFLDKPLSFILKGGDNFPIFVNNLTNKNYSIFEIDIFFENGRLKYCDNGFKIIQYNLNNKYFKNKMKLKSKPLSKNTEFLKSFKNQYVKIQKTIIKKHKNISFSEYENTHNLCFDIINKSNDRPQRN